MGADRAAGGPWCVEYVGELTLSREDPPSADFSLVALYAALDGQRQARGLSWAAAAREIGRDSTAISPSTVKALRTGIVAEGDGVLQMLLWLQRSPESFVPRRTADERTARLPIVPPDRILRFDTRMLYGAVNGHRKERQLSWTEAAIEIGVSVHVVTSLSNGGVPGFLR